MIFLTVKIIRPESDRKAFYLIENLLIFSVKRKFNTLKGRKNDVS